METGGSIGNIPKAMETAAEWHKDQVRKGTQIPYISHLLGVAAIVWEHGGGEDEIVAAFLHDAAEDQGGEKTLAAIEAHFGLAVASIVRACSDAVTPKGVEKLDWTARKLAYIQGIAAASPSVRLVSMSDKLYNARAILADLRREGVTLWNRFTGGQQGTLWYYGALVDAYRAAEGNPASGEGSALLEELDATVRSILVEDHAASINVVEAGEPDDAPPSGAGRGNDVVEVCNWCNKPVRLGNACVSVVKNIEQVDWSDDLETEEFQVIDSEGLLFLCAACGNRLDTDSLIGWLAIPQ